MRSRVHSQNCTAVITANGFHNLCSLVLSKSHVRTCLALQGIMAVLIDEDALSLHTTTGEKIYNTMEEFSKKASQNCMQRQHT